MRLPIGVVAVAFGDTTVDEAAARALSLGFEHLDCSDLALERLGPAGIDALAVPVGDRISGPEVRSGCTAMALVERRGQDRFDEAVDVFGRHPGTRLEPVPHSMADSVAAVERIVAAVPGLRLTVDTGHVATWGEDPVRLLHLADHVQLRQAAKGRPQLHPDEGGDVDFAAVLRELERLDYRGLLSVEYFDLPTYGWPLDDPVGYSVALAAHVRGLMHEARD
jgi:sugar phosphate isomerase/epimerase